MRSFPLAFLIAASIMMLSRAAIAPASSSLVSWTGRVVFQDDAAAFDWEGVSASVTITAFTSLFVSISDNCPGSPIGGGSRWAVSMSPTSPAVSASAHRISTFYSASAVGTYVMFSNPSGGCDPYCTASNATTFTLTRITGKFVRVCVSACIHRTHDSFLCAQGSSHPRSPSIPCPPSESRLSRCRPGNNLTVLSFSTDGQFLPPPPPKTRRMEFVGDRCAASFHTVHAQHRLFNATCICSDSQRSITAGDLVDNGGASSCANAAWNDDVLMSSGSRLCAPAALGGFDADCMHTAWGGISLGDKGWGMLQLCVCMRNSEVFLCNNLNMYPFTFSSGGGGSEYQPWKFESFVVDAVVINLGTNDRPAPNDTHWSDV